MTQTERILDEIQRLKKEGGLEDYTAIDALNIMESYVNLVARESEALPAKEQNEPIEDCHRIPGKDFIPKEWIDACEKYGKWTIVEVAPMSELLFQLSTAGKGGWGKETVVDFEKMVEKFLLDNSKFIANSSSKEVTLLIAKYFYELGKQSSENIGQLPTIKGWVARDIQFALRLYGNNRCLNGGMMLPEIVEELFPHTRVGDTPIEVELIIREV